MSIGTDIYKAAELLKKGELVAIPTETVYGLAANAFNTDAVVNIFKTKDRPFFDPLIIHTNSIEKIESWVESFPAAARNLAEKFWPGPLTLVLPKKDIVPDIVTAGNPTVAVRIPYHPLTLELLSMLDFPLAAPSANPFGYVSPTTAEHVDDQLGNKIPYILDGGPCKVGIESTIVSFTNSQPTVLRLGGISLERLQEVVGDIQVQLHQNSNPLAPGQMDSHYAPKTSFIFDQIGEQTIVNENLLYTGAITLSRVIPWIPEENQIILSKSGNLDEAASNIFAAIRILDKKGLRLILAEPLPDKGLGRAVNDRLKRAAHKN